MKQLFLLACIMLHTAGANAAWNFQANKKDTLKRDTVVIADTLSNDTTKQAKKKEKEKEKKPTEYEKLLKKGGTELKGLFTVRHIEDKYYFEVPDSMLKRLILCVTRYTAVPQGFGQFAGEEVNQSTIYFEKRDSSSLLMRQYVLSYLADDKDNIARTLEKSTIDPIVMSFKVIGRNEAKDAQLVEVTNLFKQDNNLMSFTSAAKTQLKVGGIQGDRTFIDTMKVFPTNIEIITTRTYGSSPAASAASKTGSVTMGFNTSMVLLPKEPMRKRLWDERVGYFVNTFRQFSDNQTKAQHESFISRYRLVPKNKKAYLAGKLSEPEKQIVYYIDPSTPKKWIPYLKQGIDDWNVAFEAAGFKNAIIAKEWPNDSTMSLDDARFSVLRYLPSETENAYGPRIVDPRSGEIIEAHICWFHNVMNLLTKWYMIQCGPLDKRAQTMKFDDKLMGQLIRFVSSHEVGHTLGLRHNMCASNATPVEKLRDKAWVEKNGHTASIMDYARFNYVAQPEDHISEKGLFPRINDYDKWAIKWGYQWRPEFKDEFEEKEKLMKETSKVLNENRRLWFLGGEGGGDDPRSQTEDLGDNSMKASEYGIKNLKRVMENLLKWTKEENDQYDDLSTMYNEIIGQYRRYYNHVMRNIGGAYLNSPGMEPRIYMPKDIQREAVQYVGRNIFDAPEWLFPDNIINKVRCSPTYTHNAMVEGAIGRLLGGYQLMALHVNACTAKDGYTVAEYLDDLFAEAWKPLNNSNEWKNGQQRTLERLYLAQLNKLINPDEKTPANQRVENSDIDLYLLQHLGKIEQFLKQQQSGQAENSINALHYQDLQERIQLIREKRKSPQAK